MSSAWVVSPQRSTLGRWFRLRGLPLRRGGIYLGNTAAFNSVGLEGFPPKSLFTLSLIHSAAGPQVQHDRYSRGNECKIIANPDLRNALLTLVDDITDFVKGIPIRLSVQGVFVRMIASIKYF
jgi:hypothetical protein